MKSIVSTMLALAASVRIGEVLLLQGTPMMGLLYSAGRFDKEKLFTTAILLAANFFLMANVFTLNDWADFARGLHHEGGAMSRLQSRNILPRWVFVFCIALLGVALALFYCISLRCYFIALIIAALGLIYSHPLINGKGIPVFSSAVHFGGGLCHFLLGYALFRPIDSAGIVVAVFFALTFTAGHLNQELRDYDVDQRAHARTNAVTFGKRAAFLEGLVLFTVAYAYLFWLAFADYLPRVLIALPLLIYPLHLIYSLRALRGQLQPDAVQSFRRAYRVFYSIIGASILVALIWR